MDWLNKYKEFLQSETDSINTQISYSKDIQKFLEWFEPFYGKAFDGTLFEQDIKEYKNYLLNILKLKPSSINRKLIALKSFNRFLVANGTGASVDIQGIVVTDTADKDIKTIDRNSFNRLKRSIYAAGIKRDIAILELLYNCGLRVSELVKLTLDDLKLTDKNGANNYSYLTIRNGKGHKYREVPLNITAKKAIQENLAARRSSSEMLFTSQRGAALHRESVDKILRKYCRIANIDEISCHVLRRTFTTELMRENTPLLVISKLLGHSSINTTVKFYASVSRNDKIAAVAKLG